MAAFNPAISPSGRQLSPMESSGQNEPKSKTIELMQCAQSLLSSQIASEPQKGREYIFYKERYGSVKLLKARFEKLFNEAYKVWGALRELHPKMGKDSIPDLKEQLFLQAIFKELSQLKKAQDCFIEKMPTINEGIMTFNPFVHLLEGDYDPEFKRYFINRGFNAKKEIVDEYLRGLEIHSSDLNDPFVDFCMEFMGCNCSKSIAFFAMQYNWPEVLEKVLPKANEIGELEDVTNGDGQTDKVFMISEKYKDFWVAAVYSDSEQALNFLEAIQAPQVSIESRIDDIENQDQDEQEKNYRKSKLIGPLIRAGALITLEKVLEKAARLNYFRYLQENSPIALVNQPELNIAHFAAYCGQIKILDCLKSNRKLKSLLLKPYMNMHHGVSENIIHMAITGLHLNVLKWLHDYEDTRILFESSFEVEGQKVGCIEFLTLKGELEILKWIDGEEETNVLKINLTKSLEDGSLAAKAVEAENWHIVQWIMESTPYAEKIKMEDRIQCFLRTPFALKDTIQLFKSFDQRADLDDSLSTEARMVFFERCDYQELCEILELSELSHFAKKNIIDQWKLGKEALEKIEAVEEINKKAMIKSMMKLLLLAVGGLMYYLSVQFREADALESRPS